MIFCEHIPCEAPAVRGGLLVVQPNGLTPTHAVYYACGDHGSILADAVDVWPVATVVAR